MRMCQLLCSRGDTWETGWTPDRTRRLTPGFHEIPAVGVGIDKNRGTVDFWDKFLTTRVDYESDVFAGEPLDFLHDIGTVSEGLHPRVHPPRGLGLTFPGVMLEPATGKLLDHSEFLDWWSKIGLPLALLQPEGDSLRSDSNEMLDLIGDAVRHVARCLYGLGGNLVLNCVEATEWLLNPTGEERDKLKERFARRAAALTCNMQSDASVTVHTPDLVLA